MKINVKETMELCAVFLRLDGALAHIKGEALPEGGALADAERDADLLLRCANLVCGEIAAEYFPLVHTECVTGGGRIPLTAFSRTPTEFFTVKKDGEAVGFRVYPDELATAEGEVEVTYGYLPERFGADGEMPFAEGKLTPRVFAYGMAAEYCLILGMYEDALIWDKRYKDSLSLAARCKRGVRLPARRWL